VFLATTAKQGGRFFRASTAGPDFLPIHKGQLSAGRQWAPQMRRYLAVSFGGGNRAPRGQDPAQLLLGQKRLDGLSLALAAIHSP